MMKLMTLGKTVHGMVLLPCGVWRGPFVTSDKPARTQKGTVEQVI